MTKITDEERMGSRVAADIFGYAPLKHKLNEQEQAELHGWVQDLVVSETKMFTHRHRWRWVMNFPMTFMIGVLVGMLMGMLVMLTLFWGVDLRESNRLALEANQIEALKSERIQTLIDGLLKEEEGDYCGQEL